MFHPGLAGTRESPTPSTSSGASRWWPRSRGLLVGDLGVVKSVAQHNSALEGKILMKTTWAVDPKERIWPVDSIELIFKMHDYIPMFTGIHQFVIMCLWTVLLLIATVNQPWRTYPKLRIFRVSQQALWGEHGGNSERPWYLSLCFALISGMGYIVAGLVHRLTHAEFQRNWGLSIWTKMAMERCGLKGPGWWRERGIDCANTHCWNKQR